MNTYYVELDFVRAEIKETGISVSQGDYGRVKFSLAVKKDGEIITDAASADISFQLTNGYIVQGKLSGEAGLYDYVFQGNELQAPGKTIATVTLNYADGRTSSEAFSFEVRYNPLYSRLINAGSYIPELENIKAQAETYIEYLGGLIEQIKQEMGQTALTKESLANNFDVSEPGLKALDAAAGRTLDLAKMDKANIVNNGLTTEEGYAADARQLNPNIANTLAWQVAKANGDLAGKFSLTEASLYLKKDGRIGSAQVLKNSDASNDYGTNITDYSDVYNTTFNIHNGLATIIRIDASGNTETCSLANQILSGDIQRIEFGHETGADPNVIKHFIAFWHTDGTKSVLSFNNGNIFYDYWDKIQWVNLWTK